MKRKIPCICTSVTKKEGEKSDMNVENIVKIDWVDDICNNYFFVLKVYFGSDVDRCLI